MNSIRIIVIAGLCGIISCQSETEKTAPVVTRTREADFAEASQVFPTIAEGFHMDLWAPGPLLSNAVALTFDNQGVAYVSETSRRKSSDIDIRAHRDWRTEDLALQSIEDTRQFHLERLATELSEQNIWQEDFNQDGLHDFRDLTVQTEYIRRIWDSDGDGRADISQVFADGFNEMLTGVAAGILYHDEKVYLTSAPDVFQLEDVNADGVVDKRKIISHGYGIHIAYAGHDMSGLTIGMDGKIYWSIGDIGVNAVGPDGKRWAYPNQGAVMRCNPDGSDFEVFAHGLRNPQELAFDNYGNLISVDNDGDHPGEHERYVHIIEGSDTGWRINWQYGKYDKPNESYKVWMDEKLYLPHFSGQAAYLLPAIKLAYNGPAGLAFNPGTAFSSEWKDYFFASYFTGSSARSKIQAFQIRPKGASFEIINEKDVLGGIVPTGITFAPDGALYVNDWKDSYAKKPQGRIWKLDTKNKDNQAIRKATQTLLQESLANKPQKALAELLAHDDQRVRLAAQFELVKKKDAATLLQIAKDSKNLLAQLHGIWGIGQLARINEKQIEVLLPLLQNKKAEIRAQTAKVIGEAKYTAATDAMLQQLNDVSPRAQFFAAEALGKLQSTQAFLPLVNLLEKIEETDPHFRHAIILALSRINVKDKLADLSNHPSKFVRIGAVVALRMLAALEVANFLADKEALVLAEAARAINDDLSIPAALPALAKSLEKIGTTNEAFLRRAINANLRVGDSESAKRLANFAKNNVAPIEMRKDALWALGYWEHPPVLDRVDGRYRKLAGHQLADATTAMAESFMVLYDINDLKAETIIAAGRVKYQAAGSSIFSAFKQEKKDNLIKLAALSALSDLESADLATAIELALVDEDIAIRQSAQTLLEKVKLPGATLVSLLKKILTQNSIPEKQKALASLGMVNTPEAADLLKYWLDKLINKTLDASLQLDVLKAIDNSPFIHLKKEKLAFENSLPTDNLAAHYAMTIFGGNPKAGRNIFSRNEAAQCLRCHAIQGYGGEVGPPLDNIADKLDANALLSSLVEPDERIAPGYGTVILKLKDGQEIAGILTQETTESITVKVGNEPAQIFTKASIKSKEVLPSGMFNIGDLLNKTQIRDLMAFLMTLKEKKVPL